MLYIVIPVNAVVPFCGFCIVSSLDFNGSLCRYLKICHRLLFPLRCSHLTKADLDNTRIPIGDNWLLLPYALLGDARRLKTRRVRMKTLWSEISSRMTLRFIEARAKHGERIRDDQRRPRHANRGRDIH